MTFSSGPVAAGPRSDLMAKEYDVTTGKRIISWLMARMARFGLGNFVVLTTTGGMSSQPREVTVSPITDDERQYLVSPYGESAWVLNARANPIATIKRGGSESPVRLVEVTGDKPELVKAYYEREGFARQFMDVPGEATVEDFASVPDRFPVFRVDPE
jgi:deazaflavin-dependent oxidoreductase (nitroreductase family)